MLSARTYRKSVLQLLAVSLTALQVDRLRALKESIQATKLAVWVSRRYLRQAGAAGSLAAEEGAAAGGTAGSNGAAPFLGQLRKPDGREALAFIRAHSPEADADLLPGLLHFTERWLQQVAFPILTSLYIFVAVVRSMIYNLQEHASLFFANADNLALRGHDLLLPSYPPSNLTM
jgi:hypothetical protein